MKLLLKYVRHPNFSVKRAAIQAYLARGGKGARKTLLKELPKEDHYILDIRRVGVHEIPQLHPDVARRKRDRNELPPLHTLDPKTKHR